MTLPPHLRTALDHLLETSAEDRRVTLDAIGDAIGSGAIDTAQIEQLLNELESKGRTVVAPEGGAGVASLRKVLPAARAIASEIGRTARIGDIAARTGLSEDEVRAAREVLERRLAAESAELPARDLVAELGLVAEREQRLAAAGGRAGARDLEHLLLGQVGPLSAPRRPGEGAVAADVAAERRQRQEHLRRVGDERPGAQAPGLGEQVVERRREEVAGELGVDGGRAHVFREHTSMRSGFIRRRRTPPEEARCDSCS